MITLRPYQVKKIDDAVRYLKIGENILFEEPTGSGKTLQGTTTLRLLLGTVLTHAIIAAPQKHIEQGFHGSRKIRWPDRDQTIEVPADFIRTAGGRSKAILEYLETPKPGYVLSCTHAALTALFRGVGLTEDLTRVGLFVDESHHAAADGLGNVVAEWVQRGGRLMYATATPYGRADGRNPIFDGMRRLRRSQAEHMEEGYAPRKLQNAIVTFGHGKITARQFTGEEVTSNQKQQRELARKMVGQWEEDGRPKLIVRIPPMVGGCRTLIKTLFKEFGRVKARICDLTGVGADRQEECLRTLASEQKLPYEKSNYDVMIGCMRVVEGTDWPVCSHVYCLGIPGSIGAVIQLIGRATRLKTARHPSRNVTKVVFFVPGDGDRLADLDIQHSRHALLVAAHMADHETASQWTLVKALRAGPKGLADEIDEAVDMDPATRAEIKLHMTAFAQEHPNATLGELIKSASKVMPEASKKDLEQVAVELLVSEPGPLGGKVRGAVTERVRQQNEIKPDIPDALKEAFATIVEEFRDASLSTAGSFAMQLHMLTGGSMGEFAKRLASSSPLTEEMILQWMREWRDRTGKYPTQTSGNIPGTTENWHAVELALRSGFRGLPGGNSLTKLATQHFDVKEKHDLTIPWILDAMREHRKRTGEFPTQTSGHIPGTTENWSSVNKALRKGFRGLPGGGSLTKLAIQHFGVKEKHDLTISWILDEMRAHHRRTGGYPVKTSGNIPGTTETWNAVEIALRKGFRGLPGGGSLTELTGQHFGVKEKQDLTLPWILKEMRKHCKRTGEYPTQRSGRIPGVDETWRGVNAALQTGLRGLPGGSSLTKLARQHLGVEEKRDLTIPWILDEMRKHHKRMGKYPSVCSGNIPGTTENWKAVNACLDQGSRGLPGGSSLAKLKQQHFGPQKQQTTRRAA